MIKRTSAKRADVDPAVADLPTGGTTEEVTATIDEVLVAVDKLLESPPDNPEEIMAQVAAIREQVAALIPDIEDIIGAAEGDTGAGSDATMMAADRMSKKVSLIIKRLNDIEARVARKNTLRQAAANNAASLQAQQASGTPPFSLRTGAGDMTVTQHKRTKRFSSDAMALHMGRIIQASRGNEQARAWLAQNPLQQATQKRAASILDFATGGILIPHEMEEEIIKYRDQRGIARQICKIISMQTVERLLRTQVDGPTGQYIGEGNTITTSDNIRYEEKVLKNKWVAIGTEWYQTLEEDAEISLADEFAEWCSYEMALVEDTAIFAGTGLSATGGIIGMPYAFQKAVEDAGGTWATDAHKVYHPGVRVATGSTWASITASDIQAMGANIANRSGLKRGFVCSSVFYYEKLKTLALSAAGVQPTHVIDGVPMLVFDGFPVYITDALPTVTAVSSIPLLFGDFGSYLLGDRKGLTVESHKDIKTQLITTVATWRFGGIAFDWGKADSTAGNRKRGGIAALVTKN